MIQSLTAKHLYFLISLNRFGLVKNSNIESHPAGILDLCGYVAS
jgi:hypothetical protein